jgi:hypothetical protein
MPLQSHQNDIPDLPDINKYVMENGFPVHQDGDSYYYNILKTVISPELIDPTYFTRVRVSAPTSFTNISYKIYGRIELWWLICIVNDIHNPVGVVKGGVVLRILKPQYIDSVLSKLKESLQ